MNTFFDINVFPKDWGLVVFPISMGKLSNSQHQKNYINWLQDFTKKVSRNQVGVHFLYSDALYMNFEADAFQAKNRFSQSIVSHKQGFERLIQQDNHSFQITSAFSFQSWFQMYLSHPDFFARLADIHVLYKTDEHFRKCIALDAEDQGRELNEQQIAFYLEEYLFAYLLLNGQLKMVNEFVEHQQKWILLCYPGPVPRGQVYLYQQDPLQINDDINPYKGQYDLERKVFIDYTKIDLESYTP